MSRVKMLNLLALLSVTCSCALNPYIDRRRNPGTGDLTKLYSGKSTLTAPAVCYNPLINKEAELQALADAECVKHNTGTHAEFVKTKSFSCTVLLPSTNFYQCIK